MCLLQQKNQPNKSESIFVWFIQRCSIIFWHLVPRTQIYFGSMDVQHNSTSAVCRKNIAIISHLTLCSQYCHTTITMFSFNTTQLTSRPQIMFRFLLNENGMERERESERSWRHISTFAHLFFIQHFSLAHLSPFVHFFNGSVCDKCVGNYSTHTYTHTDTL